MSIPGKIKEFIESCPFLAGQALDRTYVGGSWS